MKRSTKSNRVTWASGLNLCQVILFSAEDCPSKVGTRTQDHKQNDLPPGFEGCHYLNPEKDASSRIPRIGWKCPPRVVMDAKWHVAAGEESQEAEVQKCREMRMLEAVFPHRSAIPPSPSVSLNVKEEYYDDSLTPLIPQTPEEEEALELPTSSNKPKLGDAGADIIAVASAAVDALNKSMDLNSIDSELLVNILTDPKMIQNLMTSNSLTSPIPPTPAQIEQSSRFQYQTSMPTHENVHHIKNKVQPALCRISPQLETFSSVSLPRPENLVKLTHQPDQVKLASNGAHKPNMGAWPILPPSSAGVLPVQPEPGIAFTRNNGTMKQNLITDMNYIKNLIEEHGTHETALPNSKRNHTGHFSNQIRNLECGQNVKRQVAKPKFQKPCMYFQGPRGCRNGSNCQYQHDLSYQFRNRGQLHVPVAKRVKLSGEITIGRA